MERHKLTITRCCSSDINNCSRTVIYGTSPSVYHYRFSRSVSLTSIKVLMIFVLLMSINCVDGYPNGAPDPTACSDMLPSGHGANPQLSASPYSITASSSTYSPGQQITVTLTSRASSQFKGFLIEGRLSSNNMMTGQFTSPPGDTQLSCSNQAVTHTTRTQKSSVSLTWVAPDTAGQGSIYFEATVVQNTSTFWMSVKSSVIAEVAGSNSSSATVLRPLTTTTKTPLSTTTTQTTSGCGQGISCFKGQMGSCPGGPCAYALTWSVVSSEAIEFNLTVGVSSMNSWVAFGLSPDGEMSPASVVECVYDDTSGLVKVRASQNDGDNNQLLSNDQLGLVPGSTSAEYKQGQISCRFQRLLSVSSSTTGGRRKRQGSTDRVYPLDSAVYYILIAQGTASGGVKQYHANNKVASSKPVNFTAFSDLTAESSSLELNLIKAHGVIMVIAWMVFASFGVLMPRYCKLAWPETTWGGKKVWFQIHQPCMIIVLILTTAGFIIIFCEAREYVHLTAPTVAHPPLGIIVMILVLTNPIMAIFRCEPNAKKRPIFNVFHFIVGFLAHATAVTTIFLGLYMVQLDLPFWTKAVMILYICFHAVIEIVLAVHMHILRIRTKSDRPSSYQSDIPMEPQGSSAKFQAQPTKQSANSSGSTFKSIVLAIHLIGCVGCAVAISVQICLST